MSIFKPSPVPRHARAEVQQLLDELIRIGTTDDFLSEHPGYGFNGQCRHIRTRQIGQRLLDLGGLDLMQWVFMKVKRKIGKQLAAHLEYAWAEIGNWQA